MADPVTVFLGGDVMPGRGVDQILPHPVHPELWERSVDDARTYVALAERAHGPIPRPVTYSWPWGDALAALDELAPDVRMINLETSITTSSEFAAGKAVHYRMSPGNVRFLTVAAPDACVLANNHVLDFGQRGLADTLDALSRAGLRGVGAGRDARHARRPVACPVSGGGRVVVLAYGMESSGIPPRWAATENRPGVSFVDEISERAAAGVAAQVLAARVPGDVVVVSLHWGSNWGYRISPAQIRFAHRLIDAGVDIVYGHSSHHPRPIEVYRDKLILYGCGDLIDDYEGIRGHEEYRDDLRVLYLATVDPGDGDLGTGSLVSLRMVPMRSRAMRLQHASGPDREWLRATLESASREFGTRLIHAPGDALTLRRA